MQQDIHPDMQILIQAFEEISQEPNQIPLAKEIVHRITSKEGTEPINVRAYRYDYFKKTYK